LKFDILPSAFGLQPPTSNLFPLFDYNTAGFRTVMSGLLTPLLAILRIYAREALRKKNSKDSLLDKPFRTNG
jgi:hypothetical protein